MRQTAKRLVEKVLRLGSDTSRCMRGRPVIVAYHNVVPDGFPAGLSDDGIMLQLSGLLSFSSSRPER